MLCKKNGGLFAVFIAVFVCIISAKKVHAEIFEGLDIHVEGSGPAMVFIPGLNSASSVFKETCAAFKKNYTCHLLQLPGFAGLPATKDDDDFLLSMRAHIEHYMRFNNLKGVTLIGHSLGGTLSLMIAAKSPELVNKIIIIDALPFFSAIQNPTTTADIMKPQAEQMRAMMTSQSVENYIQYAEQNLKGMSNSTARIPQLITWLKASDRTTTITAMYSMMVTDLRKTIATIKAPILVLGSWAAYKQYGSTKDSTKAIFTAQYAEAKRVDIRMSVAGFHFLMWDDSAWLNQQVAEFLTTK